MTERSMLALRGRNPDVLTCIANLSNDEVFTPPELANQMLDGIAAAWAVNHDGDNIWADKTVTFLDPFTKSGVFLREITKRLVDGLASQMPDLQRRVDHILTKQVFGMAITELTALLARRSVYCSKWADREHSICTKFSSDDGNIWFEPRQHTWVGGTETVETADADGNPVTVTVDGRCSYCGASQKTLDREEGRETHAYALIHIDNPRQLIREAFGEDMQFDVIIGNPPYQMTGGGGGSNDSPIYQFFIKQAMNLDSRFLSMVIPSRWMAGGRGLGEFRQEFLGDRRIRTLVDYENAKDVFPTVGIGGGICYFLWNRDTPGQCECTYHRNGEIIGPVARDLDEFDVFVRDSRALSILRKVLAFHERPLSGIVSGDTPFGLATNFKDYKKDAIPRVDEVLLYANEGTRRVRGAVARDRITKNTHLIDTWKLLLPKTGSGRERERSGVDLVLGPSIVAEPESVCTQTYLVAGPLVSQSEAESLESYLCTKFVRYLVSLRKPAQDVFKGMYAWVPMQLWDRPWSDHDLYTKYGLSSDEIESIESLIRPMLQSNQGNGD
ncbi:MAG: Eco57I restriction-modification methylase domain-containing protein [Propionibacteriaceae bacterium]|jgi:site-specific DNA-methyltransferase (adenine-specific)|nr:Eco57I restriction-modification methylase domain-containing protein [Propionibacteriaceae bacterium]